MKNIALLLLAFICQTNGFGEETNRLHKLNFLIGDWSGTGTGFGNDSSYIISSFRYVLDDHFIEVSNESWFQPTKDKPKGEHHLDRGMISFDKSQNQIIYRQFHNEGFVNEYVLVDSLSTDSTFVFLTRNIENFVPGGKARFTIQKYSPQNITTFFDVSFPNKPFACFGTNELRKKATEMSDKPKVTGIGGIFFFSENTDDIKDWYSKNLGLSTNEWGSTFEFRNANRPDEINYLQWSPFKKGSEYFSPSKKEFMVNYRVQHIEALVEQLKENGVEVLDEIETYDYGKFVHIMDPEGNKIELWEPVDHVFTQMGGETTK